jgi:hypothetical protein
MFMLFLFSFIFYKLFFYFDTKSEQRAIQQHREITRLNDDELSLIQEGDIILRRGFGFFSDLVSTRLNDSIIDVTHAGILTFMNGKWCVIHSLSSDVTPIDGMQIQSLEKFLRYSQPNKIIVSRIKNLTPENGQSITTLAKDYLRRKIPFDHKGDYENDDQLYCTELIWRILEKDLNFLELPKEEEARKKLFYTMNGLYDPYYFDIILNQYHQKIVD